MDLGLKDKVAIVTGGSRGIGRAICLGLAAEGCNVALCARGEERLRETEAELKAQGVKVLAATTDVTQTADAERFVAQVASEFGRIDVLVNNVGGSRPGDDDEAWQAAVDLNFLSAVRCTRAVLPHMRAQGSGCVIHISSIYGRESGGGMSYNATKAAMISHAKALALQLAPEGIRVNSIAPGSIQFPGGGWDRRVQADPEGMAAFVKQNIAAGRFGTVEEVADAVVFLASERARWITGACINVDGGQSRSNI
ncbi:MAG TPA: SDR family oxidoreductase [Dehalococcoidia bacterium]|nr:SDR family oxidoreductase [Dehalococcoidia bacterium]